MRLMLVTFYSAPSKYEKHQRENIRASSAYLDTVFPEHQSDDDEPVDGVVETDFAPAYAAVVMVAAPTGCLDSDCSIECENCEFGGAKAEEAEEMDLASVLIDMKAVDALLEKSKDSNRKKGPSFFHCGAREAQFDLYGLASNCRGSRGRAELQFLGRMGC